MYKNKASGFLTLSFDDCHWETVKNTLPLLKKYHLVGTFNAVVYFLGKKLDGINVASADDLYRIDRMGMEIASHSLTHVNLTTRGRISKYLKSLAAKQNKGRYLIKAFKGLAKMKERKSDKTVMINLKSEIVKSRDCLTKMGFKVVSFVYPGGNYNKTIKDFVKRYYLSARSTDAGLNKPGTIDLYGLKIFAWDKWTTPDIANKWVDMAIKQKAWLIETFHLVAEKNKSNYEYFTSVSDFEKHLKYLKTKKIRIVTQGNVIKYIRKSEAKK